MDNQLIPIRENNGQSVVSARDLHNFLEVKSDFTDWCKRMFDYGFTEGVDYQRVYLKNEENSKGGRPSVDYAITIDTAKEISMLQRTDKGKQARLYFIEAEKQLRKQTPSVTLPQTYASALRKLAQEVEEKERLETQVKELAPKAEYTDVVLQSKTSWTITTIAKELGMTAQELNTVLAAKHVQYKKDGHWLLYAKFDKKGFIETRTHVYTDRKGDVQTNISTVWTETGRNFIHLLLNPKVVTVPRELPEDELQLHFSTQ